MKYFLDTEFLEGPQKKLFGYTKPTIDLISIGIVAEDGRECYIISKDFNLKEAWNRYQWKTPEIHGRSEKEYWVRDNVLKTIFIELWEKEKDAELTEADFNSGIFNYKEFKRLINKYGKTNKEIAEEVFCFCNTGTAIDTLDLSKATILQTTDFDKDDKHLIKKHNLKFIFPKTPIEFYAYYADYDWVVLCWLFGRMIDLPEDFPMYCKDLKQMLDEKVHNMIFSKRKEFDILGNTSHLLTLDQKLSKIKKHKDYPKQENEHNALDDAKWNKKLYEFLNKL